MFVPENHNMEPFGEPLYLATPTMHGYGDGKNRKFRETDYVEEAVMDNWVSTEGANIKEVERSISGLIGVRNAVGLSCGTAALHLAVKLAGVGPGTKVACSDMTFAATANPIRYEGGIPVLIDTEYDTWNMDPVALEKAFELYPEIKAVVMAHLYGTPGKIDDIREICRRHKAVLIEDAAESLGATYRCEPIGSSAQTGRPGQTDMSGQTGKFGQIGISEQTGNPKRAGRPRQADGFRQTGSFGDIACISFNGNKIITGSAGGMLLSDNKGWVDKARKWSTQSREAAPWYQHEEIGYNYRMSNIIAGVVRGQIPFLDEHIKDKKRVWERYRDAFKDLPVSMNPADFEKSSPNYWLSCIIIDRDAMCRQARGGREALYSPEHGKSCPTEILERLAEINAQGRPVWKPMHLQPLYWCCPFVTREGSGRGLTDAYMDVGKAGADGNPMDVGADVFDRGLCLPSDNKMTEEQQDRVIEVVRACFE